jgi:dTDP-4-dehydrorhamnose reductase
LENEVTQIKVGLIGSNGRISKYFIENYQYKIFPIQLSENKLATKKFSNTENFTHAVISSGLTNIDYCNKNPLSALEINLLNTFNLIDILLENRVIPIFLSSVQVYKDFSGLVDENSEKNPINVYGHLKLAVEKYLERSNADYLVLRIGNIIFGKTGFGDKIEETISLILNDKQIASDQLLNLLHIKDLHYIIDFACNKNINGIYNISNNEIRTRRDLAIHLVNKLEKLRKSSINFCNYHELHSNTKKVYLSELSSDKLKSTFGVGEFSSIISEILNYSTQRD